MDYKKEIITPESKELWLDLRVRDITSTESSSLFGISPYLTKFELWHRKKCSSRFDVKESERMVWGNRLQETIADGIALDNNWTIRNMSEYIRLPELKMGSSFDYEVNESAILEIKNVDKFVFKNEWTEDDAPFHIELQVQHQLAVSGYKTAYIGVLIGGNEIRLYKRERNEKVIESLFKNVSKFWSTIIENKEPEPDFDKDYKFIRQLYLKTEKDKIIGLTQQIRDLAYRYDDLRVQVKDLKNKQIKCKSRILKIIGDAEKVVGKDVKITSSFIEPKDVSYTRDGYRSFCISVNKLQKEKRNEKN